MRPIPVSLHVLACSISELVSHQFIFCRCTFAALLSIMRNDLDSDVVEDPICDEVPVLYADCNSCTCCPFCCSEESTDPNDPYCHYDFNFYDVVGTVSYRASSSAMLSTSLVDVLSPVLSLFSGISMLLQRLAG